MKRTFILATAFALVGGMASALTSDALIADLTAQGYTRIEVKRGVSQMKVEAIRGAEKLEVVYDTASGTVLKSEIEAVEAGDNIRPGVQIRDRNRDFVSVRTASNDDDSNDDHGSNDDADDDHGNDHTSGHDANDDHSGQGGHGGGDDDGDDDNGGSSDD